MTLGFGVIVTYLSFLTLGDVGFQFSKLNSASLVVKVSDDGTVSVLRTVPSCWADFVGSGPTAHGSVICFGVKGSVSVASIGGDEGLESQGQYQFLGSKIEFVTDFAAEGWHSVFAEDKVTCEIQLISPNQFLLNRCHNGNGSRRVIRMNEEDERWFLDNLAGK